MNFDDIYKLNEADNSNGQNTEQNANSANTSEASKTQNTEQKPADNSAGIKKHIGILQNILNGNVDDNAALNEFKIMVKLLSANKDKFGAAASTKNIQFKTLSEFLAACEKGQMPTGNQGNEADQKVMAELQKRGAGKLVTPELVAQLGKLGIGFSFTN